jgi:phosphate acetyltransferase
MPSEILQKIKSRAAKDPRRILLVETQDERIIRGAVQIAQEGFAKAVLMGDPDELAGAIKEAGGRPDDFQYVCIDRGHVSEFADIFFEKRKHKGISRADAERAVSDPIFYAAMLLRAGDVDGMVAGSASPSAQVVRAAILCIGPRPGLKTISSCFLMIVPLKHLGVDGVMLFSDCAVVPEPTVEQLVDITLESADSWRLFAETEPVVAVLSFSTKSSTHHALSEKAVAVVEEVRRRAPDLAIDGELQADAALIPDVAARKCPDSPVGGRANVLIFPDLNTGNVGCKLAERCSGGRGIGPLLQGLAKPVSDLSRGCRAEDIADVAALTALQALATSNQSK